MAMLNNQMVIDPDLWSFDPIKYLISTYPH